MAVQKYSSKSMFYSRLLSETAEDLGHAVQQTVRMARREIRKSENIIAQSRAAIERARKVLDESRQRRSEIIRKGQSSGRSNRWQ